MARASFRLILLTILVICGVSRARAQATLLLEEPYSYDGAFAGTGHSAIYLSRVCAASPLQLRRCEPGEWGVVLSRYHGMAGYDWLAVPLIPYLYAVDEPETIPLYADTKLVAFLREQYLARVKDALADGAVETKNAPWYELAGSAYDRTLYGYKIETTPEQDDELIRKLNFVPNRAKYNLLKSNCADFVKDVVNFYYPKAAHRSIFNDLGVTTPRQVAKSLVRSSKRRQAMQLSAFIIPQVPGTKRSRPIHGVVDSILLAKKYMAPLLFLHPVMAGSVGVAYWAGWRFKPAKDATIFDARRALEPPLSNGDQRTYKALLDEVKHTPTVEEAAATDVKWKHVQTAAEPGLDKAGLPIFRVQEGDFSFEVGLARGNVLHSSAPPQIVQQLLITRLEEELRSASHSSQSDIESDWKLLQQTLTAQPVPELRIGNEQRSME